MTLTPPGDAPVTIWWKCDGVCAFTDAVASLRWLDEHEWCPDCRGEVEKLARLPKARLVLGQIVVSPEGLR